MTARLRAKPKKRKVAIIAGSRGEYGYYRPIIQEIIKRPGMDYGLVVSNMHLLDRFGSSIDEIRKDGFKIDATIHNTLDGYNHLTMVKSLGIFLLQLPEIIAQMGADMLLVAGDRGEQLAAAMAGAHMYLPVAHIQAGEVSGNIDGMTRHAITKYAHLHFAANKDAYDRVVKMGEEKFRVFNVGAPMLDELVAGRVTPKKEIFRKFNLNPAEPILLLVQHSVTEEFYNIEEQIKETMAAVNSLGYQTVAILNNSDAGSNIIRRVIESERQPALQVYPNVRREDYLGLFSVASVLVGNSSSGILEAPTFKLPAINIGNRQKGRMQSTNVINVGYDRSEIIRAIKKALSPAFRERVKDCVNCYGDGRSSKRIVDILEDVPIDDKLLVKRIAY